MDFHTAKGYSWKSSKSPSSTTATGSSSTTTTNTTTTATTTDKTKSQQQQIVGGGTLRARENQEFRHWMDRAIEASALRIAQNRFVPEQTVVTNTPEVSSLTSVTTVSLIFHLLILKRLLFLLLTIMIKYMYSHHNIVIEVRKKQTII